MALREPMADAANRFDYYCAEAERMIEAAARETGDRRDILYLSLAREHVRKTGGFVGAEETHDCAWHCGAVIPTYRRFCSQRCSDLFDNERIGMVR